MKSLKFYIIIACLSTISFACDNWLEEKQKKLVEEEELFSNENGFKEVLTGVYLKLGRTDLYGRDMTYGFMDILAQYYEPDYDGDNRLADPLYYTFPSTKTSSYTETLWKAMYNEIANINNLLFWIDEKKDVITTPGYYEIIKGEALGLRAFLHFDLLRMYGPIYSVNKDTKSIVYRTEFSPNSQELLPAAKVIELILKDLQQAETLLVNDPLSFEFPETDFDEKYNTTGGDPFLIYRFRRMNLYAAKALAARVNLYAGNKNEAVRYAKEVIDSQLFKLVYDNTVNKVYSTELIFSIYIPQFSDQVADDFRAGTSYFIRNRNYLDEIYDVNVDGKNDIRYKAYKENANGIFPTKFDQTDLWVSTEGTIPLIRLSEMYYIMAECTDNYNESCNWLNKVREIRGVDGVKYETSDEKLRNIEKEYRKDFYGEGQLFFFYKRNYYRSFLHCPLPELTEKNYIFNLPENEILFGAV